MFSFGWEHLNPYRLGGDISHVLAVLTLLWKLGYSKSACGISGKTQILLAATYTFRYMDLWFFGSWISYYNTFFKIFYIGTAYLIIYLTYCKFKESYEAEDDSFKIYLLIFPVSCLAYLVNHEDSFEEVTWSWSIYMEAVALIPQIFMIWRKGRSESYMVMYLFYMAAYRGLYILNWVYRYQMEEYYDAIAVTSGVIETSVGVFGFLCVVSQQLARLNETSFPKKSRDPIYFVPSVFDDVKDGNGKGSGGDGGGDRGCSKTDGEKGKYNFHLPV